MAKTEFTALVENIYFSANITSVQWNQFILQFAEKLQQDNLKVIELKEHFILEHIQVIRGISRYAFGFSKADKFRIYLSSKVSDNYPIYVIVNAQYLHLHNIFEVMISAIETILEIIEYYSGYKFKDQDLVYKLSRIDICNHTTAIDLQKYIKPNEYFSRTCTKLKKVFPVIEKIGESSQETSYFRYGSGALAIRFYNKVREICEMQYKAFFFKKWLDMGLIDQRTYEIYEKAYLLYKDYRIDFIYSHLKYHEKDLNPIDMIVADSIYNSLQSNAEKYQILTDLIIKYNIKYVKEVVNVEYQVRGEYLKSLKIGEFENEEKKVMIRVIQNQDIFDIFENINIIYKYLTHKAFRVLDRNSKAKRNRDKLIDPIWKKLQNCQVINSFTEYQLDQEKVTVYHEYNKNMEDHQTLQNIINKIARLYYLNTEEIDINSIESIQAVESMQYTLERIDKSENLLKLEDRIQRQVVLYGEKKILRDISKY